MASQAPEIHTDDGTCRPQLKRSLSRPLVTLYGLGTTINVDIYVLVGKGAGRAGLFAPVSST